MDPVVAELIDAVAGAYSKGGWLGAIATVCLFGVRVYRLEAVQAVLPERARWGVLKPWAKVALPFALAAAGSGVLAWAGGGLSVGAVVAGAISAGLAAIGGHHGTKAAGRLRKPTEQPTGLSRAVDLIAPLPTIKHKIDPGA